MAVNMRVAMRTGKMAVLLRVLVLVPVRGGVVPMLG
jgi:hypothetical protein